jgi:hypothetical protein
MMIEAIVGVEGTGKTPFMLEEINRELENENSNIIFIEYGRRIDRLISHKVRLIDITEYPVRGYDGLLAFISGLNAKDYDLTHIFIDSVSKIAASDDLDELEAFVKNLSRLAEQVDCRISLAISCDFSLLPESIQNIAKTSCCS